MMFRTSAERLLRNRVFRRRLKVGARTGPIYVSPDAQLRYLKSSSKWDQDLIRLAENYVGEDSVVWDVGANIGVFAFAAALCAPTAKVFAFDPDTFLCEVMRRTQASGNYSNVAVVCAAVSEAEAIETLMIARRGRASNALQSAGGRSQMGGVRNCALVPVISGDFFAAQTNASPSIIKIDVEGAELSVLRGMSNVLRTSKPLVYIEIGADKVEAIETIFSDLNYRTCETGDGLAGNFLFRA